MAIKYKIDQHHVCFPNIADIMKYEVQRELGVSTRIGRYFGSWTITD